MIVLKFGWHLHTVMLRRCLPKFMNIYILQKESECQIFMSNVDISSMKMQSGYFSVKLQSEFNSSVFPF